MRRAPHVVPIGVVIVFGLLTAGPARITAAQDATPSREAHGFVGSWELTVREDQAPPFPALATIGADGTLLVSPPPVVPPAPRGPQTVVHTSAGHGVWEATGPATGILTFVLLAADAEGRFFATRTVRADVTLDGDGQTFRGAYAGTVADPSGSVLATDAGMLLATRIVAEAPEPPNATPAAGTPNA